MALGVRQVKITVLADSEYIYYLPGFHSGSLTLGVFPENGGDITVYTQIADGGSWVEWPKGAVTSSDGMVLISPVYALKFVTNDADAVVEIAQ